MKNIKYLLIFILSISCSQTLIAHPQRYAQAACKLIRKIAEELTSRALDTNSDAHEKNRYRFFGQQIPVPVYSMNPHYLQVPFDKNRDFDSRLE